MFNKTEADRLITAGRTDERKLADAQKRFRAMETRWSDLQWQIETLESNADALAKTFRPEVSEVFFAERERKLLQQRDSLIRERDELTAPNVAEVAELKQRVFRRNSRLYMDFWSWASVIIAGLPDSSPRRKEILADRDACETCGSIETVVKIVQKWADQIESEPGTTPLFRLNDAIAAALQAA